jgi:hypothetical protein
LARVKGPTAPARAPYVPGPLYCPCMTPDLPQVATRDEWLAARRGLLAREKALTRERDALNADRHVRPGMGGRLPSCSAAADEVSDGLLDHLSGAA